MRIAPGSAGNNAPLGGLFFAFQSSQMVSMVTHSTPSNLLMFSMCLFRTKRQFSCFVFPLRKEAGCNLPLEHHQAMRMTAHVRVHRHGVHESLVVLAVEELEAVHPHLLDVSRVHPAVTIGCCIMLSALPKRRKDLQGEKTSKERSG